MNDDTLKPYTTGSHRADRCVIACAGLDQEAYGGIAIQPIIDALHELGVKL